MDHGCRSRVSFAKVAFIDGNERIERSADEGRARSQKRGRVPRGLFRVVAALSLLTGAVACSSSSGGGGGSGPTSVISQDQLDQLSSHGFTVNGGSHPPQVSGKFTADNLVIKYDSTSSPGTPIAPASVTFSGQTSDGTILVANQDVKTDGSGVGSFITGDGQCFTVYVPSSGTTNNGQCNYSAAFLFSGCLAANGLSKFQWAYSVKSTDGGCSGIVEPGHIRVMDEGDGVAEKG